MPGSTIVEDIELIIEDIGGGGGKNPPPGGDDGDEGGKRGWPRVPSSRRYATAIVIAIVSIVMFFMAMASAFIYTRANSNRWVPLHLPWFIWVNTAILLLSSITMELARRRLALADVRKFRQLWFAATALGILFLVGQLIAWRQFVLAGFYVSTNQASSFFYIFTGAHALHLLGGVTALIFVARRNFDQAHVTRSVAAEVTSYYWHFMDALWLFLLVLLYLGK